MPDAPDPAGTTVPATDVPVDTGSMLPDTEPDPKPDREAAKYRRQLRETEARATTLATCVETMQRREVERLAGADLITPADLWLTGPQLAELLDDDGDVSPEKVTAAVAAVIESRPGWKRPDPPPGFDGGVRKPPPSNGPTMQDLLQGRHPRHR